MSHITNNPYGIITNAISPGELHRKATEAQARYEFFKSLHDACAISKIDSTKFTMQMTLGELCEILGPARITFSSPSKRIGGKTC